MTGTNKRVSPIDWTLEPASSLTAIEHIRNEWDALNQASYKLPFMDAIAIDTAYRIFGSERDLLATGRVGSRVVAMALLTRIDPVRWTTFQPSQLPLGAWLCSPELSLEALSRSLIGRLPGFTFGLSITQADPLHVAREADSSRFRTDDYIDTAWVDIQGSYDAYWSSRGKNLRQNMRKQRNKLEADGTKVTMRRLTEVDEMDAAIARYGALESRGWKSELGTAIHPNNDQGRYYSALLKYAAGRGEAVVYEYLFDDLVVASNLCVRRDSVQVLLKTTYDESYKQISPAFLLLQQELVDLFAESRIARLEFYGRMKDWHLRWTENKRTQFHVTAYRSSIIRKLAERRRTARSLAKSSEPSTDNFTKEHRSLPV